MKTDLDTLATALYARIDDELEASPWLAPCRPAVGIALTLSDAELVTLAVMSALLTSMIRILARDTSLWSDDVWLVDSTRYRVSFVNPGCRTTPTRCSRPRSRMMSQPRVPEGRDQPSPTRTSALRYASRHPLSRGSRNCWSALR